jgi:anti-sigma factor ChrR (cupin superfamily)
MSSPNDSECAQTELVTLYALGVLPAAEISGAQAHLATCSTCRLEVEALRPVLETFGTWPSDAPQSPSALWERLSERIGSSGHTAVTSFTKPYQEPEWEEAAPGISCKLLARDLENDRVSMLVRLAPGTDYPSHTHAGVEELHLLDGELWIDDRKLYAGDYNRATPGTTDRRVWSETGCTCVLITSTRDVLL